MIVLTYTHQTEKMRDKLPSIEKTRSSSLSRGGEEREGQRGQKTGGTSLTSGYYARLWDNLVSQAARDVYRVDTRSIVKPFGQL